MRSRFCALAVLAAAAAAGTVGCGGSTNETPTNPDLKVPDVPPGKRDKMPSMDNKTPAAKTGDPAKK